MYKSIQAGLQTDKPGVVNPVETYSSSSSSFDASKSPYFPNSSSVLISEFMAATTERSCISVSYLETAYDAIKKMTDFDVGSVVVLSGSGRILGIFTERDYLRKIALKSLNPRNILLRDLMSKSIGFVLPEQNIDDCSQFFIDNFVRHAPVVKFEGDSRFPVRTPHLLHLVGMVSVRDVIRKLYKLEKNNLRTGPDKDALHVLDAFSVRMEKLGLKRDLYAIEKDASVMDALRVMVRYNVGPILVKDGHKTLGIFTEHDYCHKIALDGRSPSEIKILDMMTPDPIEIKDTAKVSDCLKLFTENEFRHLPVFNSKGACVCIISVRDLLHSLYL